MSVQDVLQIIEEHDVKYVDFRFTDTKGKEQHVTVPVSEVDEDTFEDGKMFDGSSIAGWKGINESDMILMPDTETATLDPFFQDTTLNITCDIVEPATMEGYERDPQSHGATLTDAKGNFQLDMPQIVPAFGQAHGHLAYDSGDFETVFLRPVMSSSKDTTLHVDFVLQPT